MRDKKLCCCHCNYLLRGGLLLLPIWLPFLIVTQFFLLCLTWYLHRLLCDSLFFGCSPDQFLVALPLHFLPGQLLALAAFPTLLAHQVQYQLPFLQRSISNESLVNIKCQTVTILLFSVVATLSQIALGCVKPFFLLNGLRTLRHSIKLWSLVRNITELKQEKMWTSEGIHRLICLFLVHKYTSRSHLEFQVYSVPI